MKRIIYIVIATLLICSCDDFLDVKDYTQKSSQNFPLNYDDCNQALAGAYSCLAMGQPISPFTIGALASDDALGGGAPFDEKGHSLDRWRKFAPNMIRSFWKDAYAGIFRANKLRESIDQVKFDNETQRNTVLGECYFLRAYFYSELSKVFGEIPLITSAKEPVNLPKSPANITYAQIASDLKNAIDYLPAERYDVDPERFGHATRWAAEALMARVFLFYTGYYQQTELPLPDGTAITKAMVVEYLDDLIANSGHQLVDDYRNLWLYTNQYSKEDYPYTRGKNLNWAGESNSEVVWSMKHGNTTSYNASQHNIIPQYFGIRGQHKNTAFPFGWGFGFGPVNPIMLNQWIEDEPNDTIRRWGSVVDMNHPREGFKNYFNNDPMVEETGYYQKKYSTILVYTEKPGEDTTQWTYMYYDNAVNGFATTNISSQEMIFIRFSDVLLMHSELTETADGLNKVRARAKLPAVSYSTENLRKERRYELAFEAIRYWDLLRWYGKEAGVLIDENQNGAAIFNLEEPAVYQADLAERIRATGGFMQIPESQISLSDGVLTQNKGWEGKDANL